MDRRDDLAAAAQRARRLAQQTYDVRLRDELLAVAAAYEAELGAGDASDGVAVSSDQPDGR